MRIPVNLAITMLAILFVAEAALAGPPAKILSDDYENVYKRTQEVARQYNEETRARAMALQVREVSQKAVLNFVSDNATVIDSKELKSAVWTNLLPSNNNWDSLKKYVDKESQTYIRSKMGLVCQIKSVVFNTTGASNCFKHVPLTGFCVGKPFGAGALYEETNRSGRLALVSGSCLDPKVPTSKIQLNSASSSVWAGEPLIEDSFDLSKVELYVRSRSSVP